MSSFEYLVGLSAEDVFVELRKHAFYLDVQELTDIYLDLCNSIKNSNRHFGTFVDILRSVKERRARGEVSARDVLEMLDHIVK
jgi:hypothetical protein